MALHLVLHGYNGKPYREIKLVHPIYCVMIFDYNLLFIYIQVRLLVIVIPRPDAESSACN
jgi:hypothetical protein